MEIDHRIISMDILLLPLTQERLLSVTSESREHSGRVLDSRQRGRRFEPHRPHCVVSLIKTHLSLLSTGSTQEDPSLHN